MIQTTESKSRMRVPIATTSPIRRAWLCRDSGSLLDRIEIKMTLSTPSTISRNVSVMSASRPEEVKNISIVATLQASGGQSVGAGQFSSIFSRIGSKYPGRLAQREDLALPEYFVYGGRQLRFRLDQTPIPPHCRNYQGGASGAHKAQVVTLEM